MVCQGDSLGGPKELVEKKESICALLSILKHIVRWLIFATCALSSEFRLVCLICFGLGDGACYVLYLCFYQEANYFGLECIGMLKTTRRRRSCTTVTERTWE